MALLRSEIPGVEQALPGKKVFFNRILFYCRRGQHPVKKVSLMFLHLLTVPQKQTFLDLAQRLSVIDAEQHGSERAKFEDLKRRLALPEGPDLAAVAGDLDISAFDNHRSRSVAMMELLSLVYRDDFLDEAGSEMISDIALAFGFTQEDLNTMAEWAMWSLELTRRGEMMLND